MTVSTKTRRLIVNNALIEFNEGDNLLDILNANKVGISQSCGGFGTCTTCRVMVHEGLENCSPRTEVETERAEERNFTLQERLACQTQIFESVNIEIEEV